MAERNVLTWPAGMAETAVRRVWFERLRKLPPGLDADAVARRFGSNYRAVLRWAHVFGYQFRDRRRHTDRDRWNKVDWSQTDAQIARELGVSRERVRQVRLERSLPPSHRSHTPSLELAAG